MRGRATKAATRTRHHGDFVFEVHAFSPRLVAVNLSGLCKRGQRTVLSAADHKLRENRSDHSLNKPYAFTRSTRWRDRLRVAPLFHLERP